MKNISYLSDLYSPFFVGGAEKIAEQDADFFKNKYNVSVITTNPFYGFRSLFPYKRKINNITKYSFYPISPYFSTINLKKVPNFIKLVEIGQSIYNFHSSFMIKKIIKDINPDLIHSNFIFHLSYGSLSHIKKPIVHTFHDYLFECPKGSFIKHNEKICNNPTSLCVFRQHLFKKLFKNVNRLIVLNRFTKNRLIQLGYNKDKIIHLPNGIKIPENKPNFPEKKNKILFIGQIISHKGVDVLIKALNNIDLKDWEVHIVGKGPNLEEIKRRNKKNDVFIHGFVSNEYLKDLLKTSKILICPSKNRDPFPTVNLEAMVNGLALIGSNISGIKDQIIHNTNGFLFKLNDPDDLREKLEIMMYDEKLVEKFGRNSFKICKEKYDLALRMKRLDEIYKELLL